MEHKELVIISTAGSVDDGKSTLIGRLLYDCDSIYQDVLKDLKKYKNKDSAIDNLAYLTDGLEAEREQGITIDVAYRHFTHADRKFLLVDVPGHEQYTRNMITGVSRADAVIIIVDVTLGISIQSKRHFFIASMMGVKNIIFTINKMDLVGYKKEVFERVKDDLERYSKRLKIFNCIYIPISAKYGDMVVNRGNNLKWYKGKTLINYLDTFTLDSEIRPKDFRMPVQYVLNESGFRGYAGKVEGGELGSGDEIVIVPSMKRTRIKNIYVGFDKVKRCFKRQSVLISVADKIDISRGDMFIGTKDSIKQASILDVILFWFDEKDIKKGNGFILKNNTKEVRGMIKKIDYIVDIKNNSHIKTVKFIRQNDIARVTLELNSDVFFDSYEKNKNTGSCIIIDDITHNTIGACIILDKKEK
ncbi:MAG: GTP-binding protein [Candidatus Paceibacterota bacterium]|jgi:sulfate adenylyltransferase subunit 1